MVRFSDPHRSGNLRSNLQAAAVHSGFMYSVVSSTEPSGFSTRFTFTGLVSARAASRMAPASPISPSAIALLWVLKNSRYSASF